jgi:anti-sigma factor RsiW
MNCPEFETILADYLDGTLAPVERASVDEHAAACPNCAGFMQEVTGGVRLLAQAPPVEPPAHLITRIAYLAPQGRTRDPFEQQGLFGRVFSRWLQPVLQPRLAMGMAMTILSFAMLKRCTGVEVHQIQPADLNPVRVWGGVEDKAMRVKDQIVKYYDNLRIVYEIETHLKDIQQAQSSNGRSSAPAGRDNRSNSQNHSGDGQSQPPKRN